MTKTEELIIEYVKKKLEHRAAEIPAEEDTVSGIHYSLEEKEFSDGYCETCFYEWTATAAIARWQSKNGRWSDVYVECSREVSQILAELIEMANEEEGK